MQFAGAGSVATTGPKFQPWKPIPVQHSNPLFVAVHLLSRVWLFPTPRTAALQASLSSTVSQSLLKFMSVELVMPPSHLISAAPFSFCLQSFPASGSFPVSQLFASGGQGTGASASAAVLPMNIHGWFSLGLTGLISLQSKGMATP